MELFELQTPEGRRTREVSNLVSDRAETHSLGWLFLVLTESVPRWRVRGDPVG
jgi:hypothetical protein